MCECFACLYIRAPLVGLLLTETGRGTESLGTVVTSASQYHLWVLGAEPWSSAIAANVLTLWAISLGPELQTFYIRLSLFISEILWTHSCDSVREDGEYWWFWLSVLSEVAVNGTVWCLYGNCRVLDSEEERWAKGSGDIRLWCPAFLHSMNLFRKSFDI